MDTVSDTDSYPIASNEGANAFLDRVTELVDTDAVEEKIVTSDLGDGCDGMKETATNLVEPTNENLDSARSTQRDVRNEKMDSSISQSIDGDGLQPSPLQNINSSPSVTETSLLVAPKAQTPSGDEFEIGEIVTDIISGWSGKLISIDGDWIFFQCRERGVVKQLRDLMAKGSFTTLTHHHQEIQVENQQLFSHSKPCDFQIGQKVWTRVSGVQDVGVVVAISSQKIQVQIGERKWDVKRFDPCWISSAE